MSPKITFTSDIPNTPKALGPYSKTAEANGFVFLSGNTGINPETGQLAGASIEEQTAQVLKNISTILEFHGLTFANVIKTTIFLTDMNDFKTVNEMYAKALGDSKPARSTVEASKLPGGSIVEIEMIAVR